MRLAELVGGQGERKQGTVGNLQQEEGRSAGNSGSRVGRRVVEGRRVSSGTFGLAYPCRRNRQEPLLTKVPGLPFCVGLCTFGGAAFALPFVPVGIPAAFLARNSANRFFSSSGVSILIFLEGRSWPGGGFPVALKRSSWAAQ